jgi:hypothetical protein
LYWTLGSEVGKARLKEDAALAARARDSEGRVLAYSIADGLLHQRFFGNNAGVSAAKDLIVVENYPGELTFYSLSTGDIKSRVRMSDAAVLMKLGPDGKTLFVLSGKTDSLRIRPRQIVRAAPGRLTR